jgi:hypothetical protein
MSGQTTVPRTCHALGVCQDRMPLCDDCLERPRAHRAGLHLATGVIDGPYRRAAPVATALKATVARLMGPRP